MSWNDTRRPPRLRSLIAVAAGVWLLAAVAQCGLSRVEAHEPHPAHALFSSLGGEFAVNVDHTHIAAGSTAAHPEHFVTAALPKPATALSALGVVVAVLAATGSLAGLIARVGRGPPFALGTAYTGQDLLTRFCLSRR
ncbi:hypothetical protein A5725_17475 [Mycobacterium kubicae]|nr:hypothetical protein A5725_17475 [Mycobacterium kubicae]